MDIYSDTVSVLWIHIFYPYHYYNVVSSLFFSFLISSCSLVNTVNYVPSLLSTEKISYFYFPGPWLCARSKKHPTRCTNKGSRIALHYHHQMALLNFTWNLLVPPSEAEWNGPQEVSKWVQEAARSSVAWAPSTPSWSCYHSSRPCYVEWSCKGRMCSSQCTSAERGGARRGGGWARLRLHTNEIPSLTALSLGHFKYSSWRWSETEKTSFLIYGLWKWKFPPISLIAYCKQLGLTDDAKTIIKKKNPTKKTTMAQLLLVN